MNIGESMKAITDMSRIRESISGDLYEDHNQMLMGRPLDFGRTLYAKLCYAFADDHDFADYEIVVDVFWDHYTNVLTAIVAVHRPSKVVTKEIGAKIIDIYEAREMKLAQIREFVTGFKEEVYKCASQSAFLGQDQVASSLPRRSS